MKIFKGYLLYFLMKEKINPYLWNYTFPFHRGDKDEFFKLEEAELMKDASLDSVRVYFLRDYNERIIREGKNRFSMVVPYDVKSIEGSLELMGHGYFPSLSSIFGEFSIPSERVDFYDRNLMNHPLEKISLDDVVIVRSGFPVDCCLKSDIEYRCCLI